MKKNLLYIFAALLLATACNYLDKEKDTEKTLESVFESRDDVYAWLSRVYSSIPDPYWGYGRHIGWEILADDHSPSERWRQWDWPLIPMSLGEWTPSTYWPANWWSELPKSIREGEIFLRNVHALPDQDLPESEVILMKYEARFLIAYYWYLLANTYGAIPFYPHEVYSTSATVDELCRAQRPYQEVIDWCDKELKELSEKLPARYTDSKKYGRATSVMCLAVRARMLLFAASPLVNGNPEYAGHKTYEGLDVFPQSYDAQKWKRASDACFELIQLAEASGHELYKEYNSDKTTLDPFASCQNLYLTRYDEGNTEILFARPGGCDYGSYENHCTPANSGGNGGYGVTQSIVDAFFMKNGLPITDPASGYVEEGFSEYDESRGFDWETANNGGYVTPAGTYNMYCNREPRFYVTVSFNGSWFNEEERPFNFYAFQVDNPHTHDAPQGGYLLRKKISPKSSSKEGTHQYRPGILYRLAEAYLNYAEALNEYDPGNGDIMKYLNLVRERAGVPTYGFSGIPAPIGQDDVREAIRRERRVELVSDGTRYDDLRRWNIAVQTLDGPVYGMNYNGKTASEFYVRTQYQMRTYQKAFLFFPIPKDQIEKNSKLVQNPFWI